jgi:uncharacterized OB-fold protein
VSDTVFLDGDGTVTDLPRFDLPTIEGESQPFWDAASEARLLICRCNACGEAFHYPRPFCPTCWSEDIAWEEASGRGTLYTYSTVFVNDLPPFKERLPYVAAAVDLEEGPRIMTNIVDVEPGDLEVGMAVEVTYRELTPDVSAPVFRPARNQ